VGAGLWLLLGLAAALGDSGADVLTKRYFSHLPPYGMALVRLLGAVPFLAAAAWFVNPPHLSLSFFLIVAAMLPLEIAAMLLYMRSLKLCHLSLCVPLLAFTPVFLIFTGWLILGEGLNRWGILGTCLVASGSYFLGLGTGLRGLWAPFQALARELGAKLMLAVAALYSMTAALFKLAILHSDPAFFGVAYPLTFTGLLLTGYPLSRARTWPLLNQSGWWLAAGCCFALSTLSLAGGVKLAPITYLVSVKRLSLLISVALGGMWLQERPILPRLAAATLMCAGVALITLKG
jgi:drug/metabolite transporter (DMT)-like permease